MSADYGEQLATSLFDRLMGRQRPLWVTVVVGLMLILIPMGAAILDGTLDEFFSRGNWRGVYLSPAIIMYILVVGPLMNRTTVRVINAFRPLVLLDDEEFARLIHSASRLNPIVEVLVFGVGVAVGLWQALMGLAGEDPRWLGWFILLANCLMFGLLGWTVYAAVAGTRLTAQLHRQPLRIDLFDTKPFEPIGRQSLMIALVFVGGIVLSMVFGLGLVDISAWQNWLVYFLLVLVIILVFFLNMRDTHRVLSAEKKRELDAVERNVVQASRALMERISLSESAGTLAAEINALAVYEQRLQATRTWPYDTAMLRTLFFSLIIPAGVELAKLASQHLF